MRKAITASITLFLAGFMLITSSCTKETSAPAGPRGAQGPAGTAPLVGTYSVSSWTVNGSTWESQINITEITQNIVDYGSVQVFIKYGSEWWALPDISGKNTTIYGYGLGSVKLINYNTDFSAVASPGSQTYKVVIISQSQKQDNPNVDWNNYNEVKRVLKLKD